MSLHLSFFGDDSKELPPDARDDNSTAVLLFSILKLSFLAYSTVFTSITDFRLTLGEKHVHFVFA